MGSYNLYETLALDRSETPDQLDAELAKKLVETTMGTPEWNEIDAARKILGNPTKRQMYDKRLDSDAEVSVTDIQHLAAMNVGSASVAAGAGVGGGVAGAVRGAYAQYPKATIGVGVLSAAVVVALIGAIVSVTGGGGDESSNVAATDNASANSADNDPNASAKAKFADMKLLEAGEMIKIGRYNERDDTFPDGFDLEYTVKNLRTEPDNRACFDYEGSNLSDLSDHPVGRTDFETLLAEELESIFSFEETHNDVRYISEDSYIIPNETSEKFIPDYKSLTNIGSDVTPEDNENMTVDGDSFTVTECVNLDDEMATAIDNGEVKGITFNFLGHETGGDHNSDTNADGFRLDF